jgi:hypothetical protein
MKKLMALLLAALLLALFVACGMTADDGKIPGDGDPTNEGNPDDTHNTDNSNNNNNNNNGNNGNNGNNNNTDSGANKEENTTPPSYQNAHELLAHIWATYGAEERFPATGGDYNNVVENAPGAFDLTHADAAANIDSLLSFPSEQLSNIDNAASLIHSMNTNILTCGAFHVTDQSKVQACADSIKNHIMTKQFICGSPEKLIVLHVPGNYLIVLYGAADVTGMFAQKTMALIPDTAVLVEQPLSS